MKTLWKNPSLMCAFFRRKKGMALIVVLSSMLFIILLVQETIFETQIEYRSAVSELNDLRAYYSAKSAMEVGILRINTYLNIMDNYGTKPEIKPFRAYVDLIWRFPFQWPPIIPKELDAIHTAEFKALKDKSFMQTEFISSIKPLSGKIDLNDMASPLPSLRLFTLRTFEKLLWNIQLEKEDLSEDMSEQNIPDLLRNIIDWIDPNQVAFKGGSSESTPYGSDSPPANRPFIKLDELRQVKGMSSTLFQEIKPFITIYGERGININFAPPQVLEALHAEFPLELAQEIADLTSNPLKPFVFTKEIFSDFLIERGFEELKKTLLPELSDEQTPSSLPAESAESAESAYRPYIFFSPPRNFILESTGFYGQSQKTLTAIYFDEAFFVKRFRDLMKEELDREVEKIRKEHDQQTIRQGPRLRANTSPNNPQDQAEQAPSKARPVIIYWNESF